VSICLHCEKEEVIMSPQEIKPRCIEKEFDTYFYKPKGVSLSEINIISLAHEELEAIRLIDVLHFNQNEAAEKMNISRSTMQRVIDTAREKIGSAIINGHGIRIEGGTYIVKKCRGRRKCHGRKF
jgi:uncharacterized protein